MYWREAQFEQAKAQLAKANNIAPKGVVYDSFPKQLDERQKRTQTAKERAAGDKQKVVSVREDWLKIQEPGRQGERQDRARSGTRWRPKAAPPTTNPSTQPLETSDSRRSRRSRRTPRGARGRRGAGSDTASPSKPYVVRRGVRRGRPDPGRRRRAGDPRDPRRVPVARGILGPHRRGRREGAHRAPRLRPYDLLITDLKMPRLSGLQLLEKIEAERLGVLTVLMTGFGTVETAIEAMKKGAYDYLLKPFKVEEVIHVVERALYRQRLQAENIRLREALTIYKVSRGDRAVARHRQDPRRGAARRDRRGQGRRRDAAPARSRDRRSSRNASRWSRPTAQPGALPSPAFALLTEQFAQGLPILAHGGKAGRFFTEAAAPAELCVVRRGAAAGSRHDGRRAQRVLVHAAARSSTRATARCSRCSRRAPRARSTTRACTASCARPTTA